MHIECLIAINGTQTKRAGNDMLFLSFSFFFVGIVRYCGRRHGGIWSQNYFLVDYLFIFFRFSSSKAIDYSKINNVPKICVENVDSFFVHYFFAFLWFFSTFLSLSPSLSRKNVKFAHLNLNKINKESERGKFIWLMCLLCIVKSFVLLLLLVFLIYFRPRFS